MPACTHHTISMRAAGSRPAGVAFLRAAAQGACGGGERHLKAPSPASAAGTRLGVCEDRFVVHAGRLGSSITAAAAALRPRLRHRRSALQAAGGRQRRQWRWPGELAGALIASPSYSTPCALVWRPRRPQFALPASRTRASGAGGPPRIATLTSRAQRSVSLSSGTPRRLPTAAVPAPRVLCGRLPCAQQPVEAPCTQMEAGKARVPRKACRIRYPRAARCAAVGCGRLRRVDRPSPSLQQHCFCLTAGAGKKMGGRTAGAGMRAR